MNEALIDEVMYALAVDADTAYDFDINLQYAEYGNADNEATITDLFARSIKSYIIDFSEILDSRINALFHVRNAEYATLIQRMRNTHQ